MKKHNLTASLLLALTGSAFATDERLEPRDLDGDLATAEAYYDRDQNITWLRDTNIGLTETFGLPRGPITDFGSEVDETGAMLLDGLEAFISGMNQSQFLGVSDWRLPTALTGFDPGCDTRIDDGAITFGSGCTGAEAGSLNLHLENQYGGIAASPFLNSRTSGFSVVGNRWLGSNGPSGRHKYSFGGQGNLSFCGAGRCDKAYVWPVHDGDIGVAAELPTFADSLLPRDLDGDTTTTEAYYYVPGNITWLTNTNLGLSDTFGLQQGVFSEEGIDINENGLMFQETVTEFVNAVNQSTYLGHNNWRLPTIMTDDPGCLRDAALLGTGLTGFTAFGADCRGAEAGEFNQFLIANSSSILESPFSTLASQSTVWLGSFGPTGRHHFFFGTTDRGEIGQLGLCPTTNGIRDCQPAAVWLVHEGDVGTGPEPVGGESTDPDVDPEDGASSGGGSISVFALLASLLMMQTRRRRFLTRRFCQAVIRVYGKVLRVCVARRRLILVKNN